MSKTICDCRGDQSETSDDGGGPTHTFLIHCFPVRQLCFHTGDADVGFGVFDVYPYNAIKIGDIIRDAWNLIGGTFRDWNIELVLDLPGVHGAHALQVEGIVTWIELLLDGSVAVCNDINLRIDISRDGGNSDDVESQTSIVGCERDVEQSCSELGIFLTRIERVGLYDSLGGGYVEKCGEKGDYEA